MIGIVVTNFNNSTFTVDLIKSLRQQSYQKFKICIVDCSSNEVQRSLLESNIEVGDERILYLPLSDNIGYFPGINAGLELLRSVGEYECIVVGNNDLIFPSQFCESVHAFVAGNPDLAVIAPDIVTLSGEHQNPHVRNRVSAFRERIYDIYYLNYFLARTIRFFRHILGRMATRGDEASFATAGFVEQGFGAVYILGGRFIDSDLFLESPSFLYHEEAFLAWQLSQYGERVYYEPSIRVIHVCKGSTGSLRSFEKWKMASKSHWELRRKQR